MSVAIGTERAQASPRSMTSLWTGGSVASLILLWEAASHANHAIPTPAATAAALWQMTRDGSMPRSILASVRRIAVGYLVALCVALPVGVAMGRSTLLHSVLSPIVEVLRPISAIAWIPAAILWFGVSEHAAYFLIFYGAFFPVLINTVSGVSRVPPSYIFAARNLGASRRMILFETILPSAAPSIVAGLRVGLGLAIAVIVAAELGIGVTLGTGVGYLLLNYSVTTYAPDRILAVVIVIGLLGILAEWSMAQAERRLIRWK